MTIFRYELSSTNLDRLPSAHFIMGVCRHLCKQILDHFRINLLRATPYRQYEIDRLSNILFCQVASINRQLVNEVVNCTMEVCHVYVDKIAYRMAPSYRREFDMNTLISVPPKILLEFMTLLLQESIQSIKTRILTVPGYMLDSSISALRAIPDRVSAILSVECSRRPNLLYAEMKIIAYDKKREVSKHYVKQDKRALDIPYATS